MYKNVIFNLDQCANSKVKVGMIEDVMRTWPSAELFLLLPITSFLTYLSADRAKNKAQFISPELENAAYAILTAEESSQIINKKEWLGAIEKLVFERLKRCAPFVSPFCINNPNGWRFWLTHFANNYRARQVYNDVLHENSTSQAHFGRAGLSMLAFDEREEGSLYLFDEEGREHAREQLYKDIPKLVSRHGGLRRGERDTA